MSETPQKHHHRLFKTLVGLLGISILFFVVANLAIWATAVPVLVHPSPADAAPEAEPTLEPALPTSVITVPIAATPMPRPTQSLDPTEEPQETEPGAELAFHSVRPGETLAIIARTYGVSANDLAALNDIPNPDLIYAGQKLRLPAGHMSAEPTAQDDLPSTPTAEPMSEPTPAVPTPIPEPADPAAIVEDRWIDVSLSEQLLTAYEGGAPVRTTLISTGLPNTPTPTGQYRIWIKFRSDDMAGPGYFIEDVPYVMYFYQGYGLHGVTWHANFGHPMSHGCVNLPTSEAEWLFDFADVGTLVNIHE